MRTRIPRFLALVLLSVGSVDATSIVVQLSPNRILVAADTRAGKSTNGGPKFFEDTQCKIAPLGNVAAFAHTGDAGYISGPSDSVASWDSLSDANEAYAQEGGNLIATGDNWAARAKRHFASFYSANPERLKQIAHAGTNNILLSALFSGYQDGKPILAIYNVYLDEGGSTPVLDRHRVFYARELPYTSHAVTEELIEGHSERTEAANAAWLEKLKSIPPSEVYFRRIEFLIQFTANYDEAVGKQVNVLEISPDKKPTWRLNPACPATK
jgi:hypothetical protein